MLASQPSYGKIILLGSLLTFQGGLTVPAYAAAKGGIGQLTKALSNEWSKHNINVNCICPGYVRTEMNDGLLNDPTRFRQISERIPAGRWGEPIDFAGPTVWLASAASKYVCGECVVVDGVSVYHDCVLFVLMIRSIGMDGTMSIKSYFLLYTICALRCQSPSDL